MKVYLFFFFIGTVFSISCVKYITEKRKGSVFNFLVTKACSCPTGFEGIMSDFDSDSCMCFLKEDLTLCESDPKCETAASIGCRNK